MSPARRRLREPSRPGGFASRLPLAFGIAAVMGASRQALASPMMAPVQG